jgi:hypothetical protein
LGLNYLLGLFLKRGLNKRGGRDGIFPIVLDFELILGTESLFTIFDTDFLECRCMISSDEPTEIIS